MKVLLVSDEENQALWGAFAGETLRKYDLIISCGDLKADYLSYLVTMARCPVLYVHGNHDTHYSTRPPLGCDCIDGKVVEYRGYRIVGLGGCRRYHPGEHQYSEREMTRRIKKLRFPLWRTKGLDLLVTHSPALGLGDDPDPAHVGFQCLRDFLDKYTPRYLCHGHVHLRYHFDRPAQIQYGQTTIINASERYELELPDRPYDPKLRNTVIWRNGPPPPLGDPY